MASPSGRPDQPQPDPNLNPNPNPNNLDDQEDPMEDPDLSIDLHVTPPTGSLRGGGPKGKKAAMKRRAQERKARKNLQLLTETLNLIPFLPNKTLDFSSHENLLRRLGLWDFVHLEFDGNLRGDLIAQLITTYNSRCSYVNGVRIGVNRADLARALNLPGKKEKDKDSVIDIEESKESVRFLEEFVSNYVLLHEGMWTMPPEVMNWTKLIREGQFEKLDWASLIWCMVEKELTAAPNLGNCYYASHMQCLIKFQKEELLREKSEKNVYDAKEEGEECNIIPGDLTISADLVNDVHGGSQLEKHDIELSLGGQDNFIPGDSNISADLVNNVHGVSQLEEHDIELSLGGQDNFIPGDLNISADLVNNVHGGSQLGERDIELSLGGQDKLMNKNGAENEEAVVGDEDVMDCEESEGDDEPQRVQWHLDGDSYMDVGGESFLRRCSNLDDVDMVEEKKQEKCEEEEIREMGEEEEEEGKDEEQDEPEEQHHEEGLPISPKGDDLEGVHSTNLLEGMETADLPFTTGLHIRDNSSGKFLVSRVDALTVPAVAETSFLSNGKREIDHENDIFHNSLNVSNKRLRTDGQRDKSSVRTDGQRDKSSVRTDGQWDKSSEFDMCMDQMQHWVEKARMLHAAKEQACGDSSMHQQVLLHELQRRENVIEHLQKAKYEERHKREMEVYRLERELYLMENLLGGYRKALKETNRAFAEYRTRCPLPDEPLYKDVSESGGLVLSTREIEKQRLKQEEEERLNRLLIENMIKDFEVGLMEKIDAHIDAVSILSNKLIDADNEVKLLKELCNRKVSDIPECDPDEIGMSSQ